MLHLLVLLLACTDKGGTDDPTDDPSTDDPSTDDPSTDDSATPADDSAPQNQPPGAFEIALSPAVPTAEDTLAVTIVSPSSDPDGDAVSYRYAWTRDGVAAGDTETIAADLTADGETWSVAVTATDGTADGPTEEASVTLGNLPPSAPVVAIEPASPRPGDDLMLTIVAAASDPEGDTLEETITWQLDGINNAAWDGLTTIPGAYVDGGETFRVTVTVSDGINEAVSATAEVVVANQPPEIRSVTVTPPNPSDSDDLTCEIRATDPDGESLSYRYEWYRDGVAALDIGDSDTVPEASTIAGEEWECVAFASDGAEEVSDVSNTVVINLPTIVKWKNQIDTVLTPSGDGRWASATGTWYTSLFTQGLYGDTDCVTTYDIVASDDEASCPSCEFVMAGDLTYDSTTSTFNTANCSTLAVDGTVVFDYNVRGPSFEAYGYGPHVQLTGYYAEDVGLYMSADTSGTDYDSYGGYIYSTTYSITSYEDSYGLLHFTGYSYLYLRR